MKIPTHYRNVHNHPQPQAVAEELIAPNMQSEVQRTINEHPEIDTMNEEERGAIIDITDWRVNYNLETPWGRKARSNDPNNPQLNTDGMTFLRGDGMFEIYDAISGIDGQSSWEGYGPYYPGENGYWHPPMPVEGATPLPPDQRELEERVTDLETIVTAQSVEIGDLKMTVSAQDTRIGALEKYTANLESSIADLAALIQQPMKCHGPVDLPIVLESFTSLRAKGDINVAVMPGQAEPPADSGDSPPAHPLAIVRWLKNRRDDDSEEGGS